ncbi:putative bacterial ABC-type protein transporter [Helianthus debilis subsp. tardiflorus]
MSNLFVQQGSTLDPRVGQSGFEIPPASLGILDTISIVFWVRVYDHVIVPMARRLTGQQNGLTQLQQIKTGLCISIFSMVCARVLEVIRLEMVSRNIYYEPEHIPMSILWQVPQYFLVGCAEVFTFIGQLGFFYEQAFLNNKR